MYAKTTNMQVACVVKIIILPYRICHIDWNLTCQELELLMGFSDP